jgi:hypothetical protein
LTSRSFIFGLKRLVSFSSSSASPLSKSSFLRSGSISISGKNETLASSPFAAAAPGLLANFYIPLAMPSKVLLLSFTTSSIFYIIVTSYSSRPCFDWKIASSIDLPSFISSCSLCFYWTSRPFVNSSVIVFRLSYCPWMYLKVSAFDFL